MNARDMGKKKRNNAIDLLRFLFCITIVCHHSYMLTAPPTIPCFLIGGWVFTDAFFFISGMFMVDAAAPERLTSGGGGGLSALLVEDVRFIFHKALKIYPYFIAAFLIEFLVKESLSHTTLAVAVLDLANSVWRLLLVYMLGLPGGAFTGVSWYISSMLIAMLALYPFLCRDRESYLRVTAPVVMLAVYVYIDMASGGNGHMFGSPEDKAGLLCAGTLRALGGISVGTIVWSGAESLRARRYGRTARVLMTVFECGCYIGVLAASANEIYGRKAYCCWAVLAAALTLTKSGVTYTSLLPEGICRYLGRLSKSIYLCQQTAIFLVWYGANTLGIMPYRYANMMPWYLVLALLLGVIVDAAVTKIISTRRRDQKIGQPYYSQ